MGCGGDSEPASAPSPAPEGPSITGKVGPAPKTKVDYARRVLELLSKDDWDAYTDVLATRADVMGMERTGTRKKSRRQRRRLRRQVNSLRSEEAERGWTMVRRAVRDRGLAWDALKLRDIKESPSRRRSVPSNATASRLVLELEHDQQIFRLDLATVLEVKRGWVAIEAMSWHDGAETSSHAESLLTPRGDPPLATGP